MKTIVFVDIDGVINAVPDRRDDLTIDKREYL